MMKEWVLLYNSNHSTSGLKRAIKDKSNLGKDYLTILIETYHGSYHTVTASYFDDEGEELYMLDHPSANFTLDDVKRYAVLRVF